MFRLQIDSVKHGNGYQDFPTYEEADAAKDKYLANRTYGHYGYEEVIKPPIIEQREIIISPEIRDEDGQVITPEVRQLANVILDPGVVIEHPQNVWYTITDVTQEYNQKKMEDYALELQEQVKKIIAVMYRINTSKNFTIEQFIALSSDPTLKLVEEYVKKPAFKTAKYYLAQVNSEFYTEQDKAEINALLDAMIAKEPT